MPARSCIGRTRTEKYLADDGRVRRRTVQVPVEQWSVCIPDHHPGYVSWDEYLATRERLRANVIRRGEGGGAAREGTALLQGLVRCGRCGRRMQVAYSGTNGRVPRYACVRAHHLHGVDHACQSLGGVRLEKAVAAAFLEAVTPAGIRASAEAIEELEQAHEERLAGQRLAVERAQFEADRAQRQYDACEPENRLVARTLEGRLEQRARRAGARASQARRAREPSARAAHERRAPGAGADRQGSPAPVGGGDDHRPRPQGAVAHADLRDRRDGHRAVRAAPRSRSAGRAALAPSSPSRSFTAAWKAHARRRTPSS